MARQELVGKVGTVSMRVRGGELPGEVRVVVGGLPHYYIAYCPLALLVGTPVLVVHARGARKIDVEPWGEPGSGAETPGPTEAK